MGAKHRRRLPILSAVLVVASCAAAVLAPVFAWVECNTGPGEGCAQAGTARALVVVGVASVVVSAASLAAGIARRRRTTIVLLAGAGAALCAWLVLLGQL